MKKIYTLAAAVIGLSMLMSACSRKQQLPQNPKDKEEYKDAEGNRWVYNSSGNFWMVYALMNSMNGSSYASSPSYRYYPSNNSWTNGTGTSKATPSAGLSNFATGSYRSASTSTTPQTRSTNTSSSVKSESSKSSNGKSFSVVSRPSSIGA